MDESRHGGRQTLFFLGRGASHSPSPGSPARFSTSSTFVSGESTPTASPALREKPAAKIEPEKDRFLWRYPRDSGPAQDAGRSAPRRKQRTTRPHSPGTGAGGE